MGERGKDFGDALREAKALGYAEADPSIDLDGKDAAAKIVILANHVLGKEFALKDVKPIEGISGLSRSEIDRRQKSGGRLRSLAMYDGRPQVRIIELPAGDPLCVGGAWNAVRFRCAYSGERVVSGPAGGGVTTARAVLRDLFGIKSQKELN
jgi:homoserine dehydrogenase